MGLGWWVIWLDANSFIMLGQPPLSPRTPRDASRTPRPRLPKVPGNAIPSYAAAFLPSLPPHSAPKRGGGGGSGVTSFSLGPTDATAPGWMRCLRGGNKLPLPLRLQADDATGRLNSVVGSAGQLTVALKRLIVAHATARDGVAGLCAITAQAVSADSAALLPATALDVEACLSEHNFSHVCDATVAASPPCQRLVAAMRHELLTAAETRQSLNISGGVPVEQRSGLRPPAALESGQVALREPPSVGGAVVKQRLVALHSALVTPVTDPNTGSTIALLICCNASAGRFALADELFCESAAQHLSLLWLHHIQMLRLVPLPSAPLPPPDQSASRLRVHWHALADARSRQQELRAAEAHASKRAGGGDPTPKAIDAVCLACRRMLRARSLELRHAMLTAAAVAPKRDVEAHLESMAERWSAALIAELRGEASRLAGPAAASCVNETFQDPGSPDGGPSGGLLLRAAQAAARHHAGRRTADPAARSRFVVGGQQGQDEGASALLSDVEQLVIQPALEAAAPVLLTLPTLLDERAAAVRTRIAENLTADATWVAQDETLTDSLVDERGGPPLLSGWLVRWQTTYLDDLRERAQQTAGEDAAAAALPALQELLSLQATAFRNELGAQLQGASLLFRSMLEQQFWRVAEWVESALRGRLTYREKILHLLRAALPRWLRHLLVVVTQNGVPAHRRFDGRASAATESPSEPSIEPPDYCVSALVSVAEAVVGEFIQVACKALEPLSKQYSAVVGQVRPRIIQMKSLLREEFVSLLSICVVHPRHVLPACRAVLRAADAVQSAMLGIETQLLALRDEKANNVVATQDLPLTFRQLVKHVMCGEMPQLALKLATNLAVHEHSTQALDQELEQHLQGWTERAYAELLTGLTDLAGPRIAEGAMPQVANVLPASAQQMARDLQRDMQLNQMQDLAMRERILEAESNVVRCMAQLRVRKHVPTAVARFVRRIGDALCAEVHVMVPKPPHAKPDAKAHADDDAIEEATSLVKYEDASAAARANLFDKVSELLSLPVIDMLEQAIAEAVRHGDWQLPASVSTTALACAKRWLSSVHVRADRRAAQDPPGSEKLLLEVVQSTLLAAVPWLGRPELPLNALPLAGDGLMAATDRLLASLRATLSKPGDYAIDPAVSVMLLMDPGPPDPKPREPAVHDLLRGSAPVPGSVRAWPLELSASALTTRLHCTRPDDSTPRDSTLHATPRDSLGHDSDGSQN